MNTDAIIALTDQHAEAGAIVWWSLTGDTDIDDMKETLEGEGFDESWNPSPPRIETVVKRAAESVATGRRQLVRPLKSRGSLEFVTERVQIDTHGKESLHYTPNARITVERLKDASPAVTIEPSTEEDRPLVEAINSRFRYHSAVMSTVDMSNWLLRAIERSTAVSLRDRGGMYFVPRGEGLDTWRRVKGVVEAVSEHKLHSVPAMHSDDAVEAVLHSLRRELAAKLSEFEEYIAGDVSPRGLNAWERHLAALRTKSEQYAELLGVALPDINERAERCQGSLAAARLMNTEGAAAE